MPEIKTAQERDKLSIQELKEAVAAEKEQIAQEAVPVETPPTEPTIETPGVNEQVTPAPAELPVEPKAPESAVTQPAPVTAPPEPVAAAPAVPAEPTPAPAVKVEGTPESYEDFAKRTGFKSPATLAQSYVELRRQLQREKDKAKLTPAPVAQAPAPVVPAVIPQQPIGYGQAQPAQLSGDEPVTAEQLRVWQQQQQRQQAEVSVLATQRAVQQFAQPLQEKMRNMEENAEIQRIMSTDAAYGTKEMQEEINNVFEANSWLRQAPNPEIAAYKIAKANLSEKGVVPAIQPVVPQVPATPAPQGGVFVTTPSPPAIPVGGDAKIVTEGKTAEEIKKQLADAGVTYIKSPTQRAAEVQ